MTTLFRCLNLLLCFHLGSLTVSEATLILYGNIVDSQTDGIISCIALVIPFECTMEFLHNNSTAEIIRNSDGLCYHKFGKCKAGICTCSADCTSFKWNFTSIQVHTNDSFGCKMRIYNSESNSFKKVVTLAIYNGTGFTSATSIIFPADPISTTVQTTPILTKEEIANTTYFLVILVVCPVVVSVIYTMRKKHLQHKKAYEYDKTYAKVGSGNPINESQTVTNISTEVPQTPHRFPMKRIDTRAQMRSDKRRRNTF